MTVFYQLIVSHNHKHRRLSVRPSGFLRQGAGSPRVKGLCVCCFPRCNSIVVHSGHRQFYLYMKGPLAFPSTSSSLHSIIYECHYRRSTRPDYSGSPRSRRFHLSFSTGYGSPDLLVRASLPSSRSFILSSKSSPVSLQACFQRALYFLSLPKEPSSSLYSRKLFTRDRRVVVNLKSGSRSPGDFGHFLSYVLFRTWSTGLRTAPRRRGSVLNTPMTSFRVEELLSLNRQPLFFTISSKS